ncbi:MAG: oligosaccharide flippase family protein [Actinomycetota bacterium]
MLLRHVAVLAGSQLSTWIIALVAAYTIPRYLGAELMGRFHLANSIWALAAVFIGFGTTVAVTRGIARDRTRVGEMLGGAILLRLSLIAPVAVAVFAFGFIVEYPRQMIELLAIVGVGVAVQGISEAMTATLKGLDRMGPASMAVVVGRLVFVGGAVVLLLLDFSVLAVASMALVGSIASVLVQIAPLRRAARELDHSPTVSLRTDNVIPLARESAPFLWIALSIALYQQLDIIILSLLVDEGEVLGWYALYERLAGTLLFVPSIFMTAVFPTISRLFADPGHGDRADGLGNRIIRKTFDVMVITSVALGFGTAAIAHQLIALVYGDEFAGTADVLVVGGVVLMLTYLTTVLGHFLIAMDKQRQWTLFILLGAVLTVPADLILIPVFQSNTGNGALGASLGFLFTESVVLIGAISLLPRGALSWANASLALRAVLAGGLMVLAVVAIGDLPLPLRVGVGAIIYLVLSVLFRVVSADDRQMIRHEVAARVGNR